MAVAAATCCFSALTSTVKLCCYAFSHRHLATSHRFIVSINVKATNHKRLPSRSHTLKESASKKKPPGSSKDERYCSYADGNSGRVEKGKSHSMAYRSFGIARKEKKEFQFDMKENQVEPSNLQDTVFLNAVVKFAYLRAHQLTMILRPEEGPFCKT